MHRTVFQGWIVLWLLLLTTLALAERPVVVATLPDLGAVAGQIAGDRAEVSTLLRAGQDPALLEPLPADVLLLSKADLLVALGGPAEAGFLPRLLVAAHNPRLAEYFDASLALPAGEAGYPLGDPRRAVVIGKALATQLALLDPAGAAGYQARAAAFEREVEQHQRTWLSLLAPLRGQKVVAGDASFGGFLAWAGLSAAAVLAPAPGVLPGPAAVLRVLRLMRGQGVRLILQREYQPANTARLLAERAGGQVVVVPLGARLERGERYVDGLDHLVQGLVATAAQKGLAGARREP